VRVRPDHDLGLLQCPACATTLPKDQGEPTCPRCAARYPVTDGVIDLAPDQEYLYTLKSVPPEQFQALLDDMRARGWSAAFWDFFDQYFEERPPRGGLRGALGRVYRNLNGRTAPVLLHSMFSQAQSYHWLLTNLRRDSVVLDFGAGWGRISHGLAKECGWVVAADATLPRLQFSSLRAKEDGIANISFVRTGTSARLPFASGSFDLVLINGVLEWLPASQPGDPTEIQREHLREVHRILKPDGQVIVAIENRYSLADLIGLPEGHVGLPWVGVLPRRLGDIESRVLGRGPLRVRTYSARELRSLLVDAGFMPDGIAMFAPQPTYAQFDVLSAIDENAQTIFPRASLVQHPAFRRRLSPAAKAWTAPLARQVAAFHAVAGKAGFRSALHELLLVLREAATLEVSLPLSELRVRESKVMFHAVASRAGLPTRIHVTVAMNDIGEQRVRQETSMLRALGHVASDAVHVPRVLWAGTFRSHSVLVLESIDGVPVSPTAEPSHAWELTRQALSYLSSLSVPARATSVEDIWRDRLEFLRTIRAMKDASRRQLDDLDAWFRESARKLPAPVLGHRDLHPENLLVTASGRIGIIDWETSGPAYPTEDAITALAGHLRQRTSGFAASIRLLVDAWKSRTLPNRLSQLTSNQEMNRDSLFAGLLMSWARHVEHADGSYVLYSPLWVEERVLSVIGVMHAAIER
jgi:2-polyprenyl-3-methyl-5-hydroxy-6-metoxy-1,4-benzoquinol methylase